MSRKNQNIHTRVEYAEINARKARRRPAKARPPAPSDPDAVDCKHHDDFAWSVYEMRGGYFIHPQDGRYNAAVRFAMKMVWWSIHGWRRV